MNMTQKQIEKKALTVSACVNLLMAAAGIGVFLITDIHALMLDGVFSLIGFISAIAATVISVISHKKTKAYPDGIYFIEPLYAIFKSLFTLVLMVISVAVTAEAAYAYFVHGIGEPMYIAPVLPYTLIMVILCFGLSGFNKIQNKKIQNTSTILTAESKSNFVDGILSLGVGLGIVLLYCIDFNGSLGFLHYTGDFFVTTILCLLSVKPPLVVAINAFKELSGGTTSDPEINKSVSEAITAEFNAPDSLKRFDIYKIGMCLKVNITVSDCTAEISDLSVKRKAIAVELLKKYDNVMVSVIIGG
jgi:predicted Co/Zn/Cd cation transporter (cation efflux family)